MYILLYIPRYLGSMRNGGRLCIVCCSFLTITCHISKETINKYRLSWLASKAHIGKMPVSLAVASKTDPFKKGLARSGRGTHKADGRLSTHGT